MFAKIRTIVNFYTFGTKKTEYITNITIPSITKKVIGKTLSLILLIS